MSDVDLLEKHRLGSDEAFAELVRRHVGWVYGVARRRLHDAHLAEDVAQAVFVLLHRKAPHFEADAAMMRWLHRSAWYCTEVALRNNRRRQRRETEAAMAQPTATEFSHGNEWEDLAPMLDELIGKLSSADREAILLRYYREMSFANVGAAIGTTEDTARKRVERAIEKLRHLAEQGGITISASVLATNLAEQVCVAAPAGLIATVTSAATASAGSALAVASAPILKGALIMMNAKLIVGGAVAAIVLVGGTVFVVNSSSPAPAPSSPVATTTKWLQFVETEIAFAGSKYPKLAPYSAIRWRAETPEVQIDETWYELVSFDDHRAEVIVQFARSVAGKDWQKRFDEDLFELMSRMGHEPKDRVKLQLKTLDTQQLITRENLPMTKENRMKIWQARQSQKDAPSSATQNL